ncbi:MAG: AAA family ATPase [Bacteroidetes bacterium]|nr:AAA family ATPase [Bacteroidota bacterium]
MIERSKLLNLRIENIGCIGLDGLEIDLDDIICLVGSNNSGKSTILRAYELAVGTIAFSPQDFCKRNDIKKAAVELTIHIPKGTPNISEDWKYPLGDYLAVKSRWEWDEKLIKKRTTWNPLEKAFSENSKASGLDNVFDSRLPKPYRIGTLDTPDREQDMMKKILLQPIADELDKMIQDKNSDLSNAIAKVIKVAEKPISKQKKNIAEITKNISEHHKQIFPDLTIDLGIALSEINIRPSDLLYRGSVLKFKEGDVVIDWQQQGTGSQRALFWSLMQVRSGIQTIIESSKLKENQIAILKKKIETLIEKKRKLKLRYAILKNETETLKLNKQLESAINEKNNFNTGIFLPGYMLLIDEPEVALHPNAIRAASNYLYDLSTDPSWQVMLTTHSPIFVDPTRDHTTIVRLDRNGDNPSPNIYVTDKSGFDANEIERLKMLNRYDQSLAEMFFGQYPLIVEGDTEFTAFSLIMNEQPEKYPISKRPILFRARGKWTIPLVIKMLRHFKINFSILHDSDTPYIANGNKNGIWKANIDIFEEIQKCIKNGLTINHKISYPNFECNFTVFDKKGVEDMLSIPYKEKPWSIFEKLSANKKVKDSVEKLLDELILLRQTAQMRANDFEKIMLKNIQGWADKYDKKKKTLYYGK